MNKNLLLLLLCCLYTVCKGNNEPELCYVDNVVDWKTFLSRHDLVWEKTPRDYFDTPFVGNGLLGAMLYQPEGELLRLDVGSTEVVERRNSDARSIVDNGRLPVGYFEFASTYQIIKAIGRLDLYNAQVQFHLQTQRKQSLNLNLKALRGKDLIVLEYSLPADVDGHWIFRPAASIVPRPPLKGTNHLNPIAEIKEMDGINVAIQKRDAGGCYVTAWKEIKLSDGRKRLLITIQDSYPDDSAITDAVHLISSSLPERVIEEEVRKHFAWWNQYYKASFVSIPHPQMESLYWGLQYRLASMMRKGAPLCDLMGPWYKSTSWPGIWFNLNTQMLFSSLHISNQMELASTLPDFIYANEANLINSIPEQWRHNAAGLVRCTGKDQIEPVFEWPNAEYPERSNLIYLMYYMWEHYRVSMDERYLKEQYFPLLKRAANFILNVVTTDEKGVIHIPESHSPEAIYDTDTNYDLSSLRWACKTLLAIDERLHIGDKQRAEWKRVLKRLAPYPVDENGYMASAHYTAPLGHRHWCHLFQMYPYALINYDQPENRSIMRQSLKHWGDPSIPNTWTQAVISSMYSYQQEPEEALKHLNLALKTRNLSANFTHSEGKNPCSETYGGLSRMLQDMLIQSWGGKIRIFPSVSRQWQDAVFSRLRAEGGFLVSAGRKNGTTDWIEIHSLAGEPCIVEHNFNSNFNVEGAKYKKLDDKRIKINLKKGQTAFLYVGDGGSKKVSPVTVSGGDYNHYGIRNK